MEDYKLNRKHGDSMMNSEDTTLQKEELVSNPSTTFGVATASTTFGVPTAPTTFGVPTASTTFGVTTSSGSFGVPSPSPSTTFGAPTVSTTFGVSSSSTSFGVPTPSTTFGAPTASTTFGAPTASTTFGAPTASPLFGAPTASPLFGAPTASPLFGAPTASTLFGAPSPSSTFGIPSPSTLFGASSSTTTKAFAIPSPTTTFAFPNLPSAFSNTNTLPNKFHFDKAKSTGSQSRQFSSLNHFSEKWKLDNVMVDHPLCIESSTQTETELCVNKLLQGLKEMLLNKKHSDFILNVKGKEFSVHKIILAAHSPVFAAMIEHDTKEAASGTANIDDFEPVNFSDFLNFLYTGKVENLNPDNVFDLYEVADKYQVSELNSLCIRYMINNISNENFCDILTLGLRHNVKELIEVATQFFLQNSKEIAITAKWGTFLAQNPVAGNELFLKVLNLKKL